MAVKRKESHLFWVQNSLWGIFSYWDKLLNQEPRMFFKEIYFVSPLYTNVDNPKNEELTKDSTKKKENKLWLRLCQAQVQLKLEIVFFVASKVKSTDQKLDQQLKT